MSSPETFAVIQQTLAAWTTTPKVYENDEYRLPDAPAPFVYVEVFGDFYDQASIGAEPRDDNLWREGGVLLLHVMTPRDIGTATARQYAKQLAGLFKGQDIDGVSFLGGSIGEGRPGRVFGNYYAMTASIDWERDE